MEPTNVDFDRTKAFSAAWDCLSSPLRVSFQLGSGADFVVWLSTLYLWQVGNLFGIRLFIRSGIMCLACLPIPLQNILPLYINIALVPVSDPLLP